MSNLQPKEINVCYDGDSVYIKIVTENEEARAAAVSKIVNLFIPPIQAERVAVEPTPSQPQKAPENAVTVEVGLPWTTPAEHGANPEQSKPVQQSKPATQYKAQPKTSQVRPAQPKQQTQPVQKSVKPQQAADWVDGLWAAYEKAKTGDKKDLAAAVDKMPQEVSAEDTKRICEKFGNENLGYSQKQSYHVQNATNVAVSIVKTVLKRFAK